MRLNRIWATTVAAIALTLTASGTAGAATVYNNIPSPLAGNYASEAFEARSISEFGSLVELAAGARNNPVVTVTMSSWGCQSGGGTTCVTTPGAVFSLPVTLNLYAVNSNNSVGALLASDTQTFKIPFRPSADAVNCIGPNAGKWYDGTSCFNGRAYNIGWDLGGRSVTLPDKVIVTVMYNTTHHGYQPFGEHTACYPGCAYDSLNVALMTGAPLVGTDPLSDAAYLSSTWSGAYGDGGAGGLGVFRYDPSGWTPYQPAIQIDTFPLQTGPTGPAGPAGPAGTDGSNGTNGTNGTNGANGTSCTVVDNGNGTKTISCGDGTSVTVSDGSAGTSGSSCTVADNGDGTSTISCADGSVVTVGNQTATPAVTVARPQTKIVKAKILVKKRIASFRFSGSSGQGKLSFLCKLDKRKYTLCRSGKTYKNLKPGAHIFRVKARNAKRKFDLTPAVRRFKI